MPTDSVATAKQEERAGLKRPAERGKWQMKPFIPWAGRAQNCRTFGRKTVNVPWSASYLDVA